MVRIRSPGCIPARSAGPSGTTSRTHPYIFGMNLFLRKNRPGADLKIVPRGNADIYPDDYNRHEGIRQIFWTTCVQKNLYQNDKEMIRIPAAKIVRTPEGVMSYLEFLKRMFFILGSYLWTYTLAQIPVGALLDRVGVKWLMRIGTILWSIATLMTAIVGGLGLIILSRFLLGIAEAS